MISQWGVSAHGARLDTVSGITVGVEPTSPDYYSGALPIELCDPKSKSPRHPDQT